MVIRLAALAASTIEVVADFDTFPAQDRLSIGIGRNSVKIVENKYTMWQLTSTSALDLLVNMMRARS